jgi:hypothetical protein
MKGGISFRIHRKSFDPTRLRHAALVYMNGRSRHEFRFQARGKTKTTAIWMSFLFRTSM